MQLYKVNVENVIFYVVADSLERAISTANIEFPKYQIKGVELFNLTVFVQK